MQHRLESAGAIYLDKMRAIKADTKATSFLLANGLDPNELDRNEDSPWISALEAFSTCGVRLDFDVKASLEFLKFIRLFLSYGARVSEITSLNDDKGVYLMMKTGNNKHWCFFLGLLNKAEVASVLEAIRREKEYQESHESYQQPSKKRRVNDGNEQQMKRPKLVAGNR